MKSRFVRCSLRLGVVLTGIGILAPAASAQTELTACGPLTSGNYVLKKSLGASGDCFTINGNTVSLDLKGKKLTGDGTGSAITDGGVERRHIVITNGKISGFDIGIDLEESGNVTLYKVDSSNNVRDGINLGRSTASASHYSGHSLNSVKANNNGGDGIYSEECCTTITRSSANGNGSTGIFMEGGYHSIHKTKATGNGGDGFYLEDCCSHVVDSTAQKNGSDGFYMDDSYNHVIRCTSSSNGGDGFKLDGPVGQNLVNDSKATGNDGDGINLGDGDHNSVARSQATKNGGEGIVISCPSNVLGVKAKGNTGGNLVQTGGTCTVVDAKAP